MKSCYIIKLFVLLYYRSDKNDVPKIGIFFFNKSRMLLQANRTTKTCQNQQIDETTISK